MNQRSKSLWSICEIKKELARCKQQKEGKKGI